MKDFVFVVEYIEITSALIAAAPDLYEALEQSHKAISSLDKKALGMGRSDGTAWWLRDELLDEIDAALRKARGE